MRAAIFVAWPVFVLLSISSASGSEPPESVEAIWRVQSLPFEYRSTRTHYACDSLQRKVREILQRVGAHPSVRVEVSCADNRPSSWISAHIAIATPIYATPESVAAVTTFNTEARMVAKMQGVSLPTASDIERFRAGWQTVSLSRLRPNGLEISDCDLWRSLRDQIFPKIAVSVTRERINCGTMATRIRPDIEVTALVRSAEIATTRERI